jgi:hypothetical protein
MSSGSKKKEPTYAWLRKAKASHSKECKPKFLPLLHTSYTVDCLTALVDEDVSSGYYV